MKKYHVAVVGGGPAGIMAAIHSAQLLKEQSNEKKHINKRQSDIVPGSKQYKVVLIEKNEDIAKKLLLTGGGRCNITNASSVKDMLEVFGKNNSFLKPSLYNLDSNALLKIFKDKGLEFNIENEGKVYPKDNKAISILNILKMYLKEYDVDLKLNSNVKNIKKKNDYFEIDLEKSNTVSNQNNGQKNIKTKKTLKSSRVILATGGVSYPFTGSTGAGMKMARHLGHEITPLRPGLIPLKIKDQWLKDLSGLKLENIGLSYKNSSKKKINVHGTVLLTHFGLSGPIILDLSREIGSILEDLEENKENDSFELSLDIMVHKSPEELKKQFNHEFQEKGKTLIKNYLKLLLPKNFVLPFLQMLKINPQKQLNQISRKEKNKLIDNLKNLKVHITGTLPIKKAMVTCGGIYHNDIDSKTMQSKLVPGMFFAGELIDFCGPTGGYNLQLAFSTGYTAGKYATFH